MVPARFESYLAQPALGVSLNGLPGLPTQQERHRRILQGREFGEQVMELPYKTDFTITEIRRGLVRQRIQLQVGAVYVTLRSTFKRTQDVQQSALARA